MIFVFHINTDDNENGWFPPSYCSRKIYVNARGWTSNPQDSKPTYDQAEHFLLGGTVGTLPTRFFYYGRKNKKP
jgi:hypothetical protein